MSSTTSWRSAAAIVCSSSRSSARIFATPNGWWMNSSPERRCWPSCALGRERERAGEQIAVEIGLVALDRRDQLVDELLMTLGYLEDGHIHSVLRASGAKPSARGVPLPKEEPL